MVLKLEDISEFMLSSREKIVVFYMGKHRYRIEIDLYALMDTLKNRVDLIINPYRNRNHITNDHKTFPMINKLEMLLSMYENLDNIVVILSNVEQYLELESFKYQYDLKNIEVHFLKRLIHWPPHPYTLPPIEAGAVQKIPKKIHYCWFGSKDMPTFLKLCIDTWYDFHPDWEIIRWDENNFDITNDVLKEHRDKKDWASICNYVRLDVIYNHGGIYLDTDVECIKPLDRFLYDECFFGLYQPHIVGPGVGFGARKEYPFIKKLIDAWYNEEFSSTTGMLLSQGKVWPDNVVTNRGEFIAYPTDVFCPITHDNTFECFTENTHTIHHHSGLLHSHQDDIENISSKHKTLLKSIYGDRITYRGFSMR